MQTDTPRVIRPRRKSPLVRLAQSWQLYVLLLPAVAYLIIFHYIPLYGVQIAFRDYRPRNGFLGSTWVGLKHFRYFLNSPQFPQLMRNTVLLSLYSLIFTFPLPILLALLLRGRDGSCRELRFGVVFSNCAFVGYPLIPT